MSAPSPDVDDILAALADPTRRGLFEAVLRDGPITATELAARLPISRQAVSKHLERLADVGLASSQRSGRETRWSAHPGRLGPALEWMSSVGRAWDRRLERLTERFERG